MDMGNILAGLATVDAIKTARLNRESAIADRDQQAEEQQRLISARQTAWNTGGANLGELPGLAPQEAAAIRGHFTGLAEKKDAKALAAAQENIDMMGKLFAWVKTQPDPASAYAKARENLPPDWQQKAPPQYDPAFVDMMLARSMSIADIFDQATAAKQDAQFNSVFDRLGQPAAAPAPRGTQAAISPSANPQGLDERIIGAVDSQSPLGGDLVASESGGRWDAQNSEPGSGGVGHYGRGQFSIGRLDDAKRAGVIPPSMTPQQFMADPTAQEFVERWHRDDIETAIREQGFDLKVGQQIKGVPVTVQGLVNVAHLGGKQGMVRFVQSGGKYDPADANGTRLSDYLRMGAQEAGGMAQGGPAAAPGGGQAGLDPRVMALLQAAGSQSDAGRRDILTKAADILLEQSPKAGFRHATPEEATAYGSTAGQFGPDGRFYPIAPPSGMTIESDGQGGFRMVQGPGAGNATKEMKALTQQAQAADVVLEDIRRIKGIDAEAALPTSGAIGALLANVPGTAAHDTSKLLDGIKANIGFDKLQAMREASPTGGALGAVSERENTLLQSVLGSLEQSQSRQQFLYNLDRLASVYETAMQNIAEAAAADGVDLSQFGLQMPGAPAAPAGGMPQAGTIPQPALDAGIDADLWQFMTPEEQALWSN